MCSRNILWMTDTACPMERVMAISTKSHKIIGFVIPFVLVYMMNIKRFRNIVSAFFANYISTSLDSLYKTPYDIILFPLINPAKSSGAFTSTKSFIATLERNSTSYYFTAKLARCPLDAREGAIFFVLSQLVSPKFLAASFAGTYWYLRLNVFISTLFRTANFSLSLFDIFTFKFLFADWTNIHKHNLLSLNKGLYSNEVLCQVFY